MFTNNAYEGFGMSFFCCEGFLFLQIVAYRVSIPERLVVMETDSRSSFLLRIFCFRRKTCSRTASPTVQLMTANMIPMKMQKSTRKLLDAVIG